MGGRGIANVEAAGEENTVGPVVAMVDDAASGNAAAELELIGEELLHGEPFLGVAKSDGGFGPAVMAEEGGIAGEVVEQRGINRHVLSGVTVGVG